ncbi:MAG: hypothetical protein MZV63_25480 [Marinilabiliales bacterium]|nr:hypothetical protein [Marinilabiliales bacterium]
MTQNNLEICLSPAMYEAHSDTEAVVVIVRYPQGNKFNMHCILPTGYVK